MNLLDGIKNLLNKCNEDEKTEGLGLHGFIKERNEIEQEMTDKFNALKEMDNNFVKLSSKLFWEMMNETERSDFINATTEYYDASLMYSSQIGNNFSFQEAIKNLKKLSFVYELRKIKFTELELTK